MTDSHLTKPKKVKKTYKPFSSELKRNRNPQESRKIHLYREKFKVLNFSRFRESFNPYDLSSEMDFLHEGRWISLSEAESLLEPIKRMEKSFSYLNRIQKRLGREDKMTLDPHLLTMEEKVIVELPSNRWVQYQISSDAQKKFLLNAICGSKTLPDTVKKLPRGVRKTLKGKKVPAGDFVPSSPKGSFSPKSPPVVINTKRNNPYVREEEKTLDNMFSFPEHTRQQQQWRRDEREIDKKVTEILNPVKQGRPRSAKKAPSVDSYANLPKSDLHRKRIIKADTAMSDIGTDTPLAKDDKLASQSSSIPWIYSKQNQEVFQWMTTAVPEILEGEFRKSQWLKAQFLGLSSQAPFWQHGFRLSISKKEYIISNYKAVMGEKIDQGYLESLYL